MSTDPQTIAPLDPDQKIGFTPLDESPPPASDEAPPAPPPDESGEGISQEPEAPADPPKAESKPAPKTEREKLIAKLTGVEKDSPVEKKEPEPPPATEPEDKAPEAPAEDSTKAPETPPAKADDDLTELTNETAKAMKPGEARRKINRLITRTKTAEPKAAAFDEIVDFCTANNLSPADYKSWIGVAAGLQQQDPNAVEIIKNIANKLGLIPEPVAPPAPTLTPEMLAQIQEWEDDADINPKVARKMRAMFGGNPPAAPAAQPPAPPAAVTQPPPPARQPAPQQQVPPEQLQAAKAAQDGLAEMVAIGERYKATLGANRWNEIQPKLSAALKARGAKPPAAWAAIYEAEVEKILSKVPQVPPVKPGVQPGKTTAPATPQFKTERERLLHDFAS
jgi:hypothetical protein